MQCEPQPGPRSVVLVLALLLSGTSCAKETPQVQAGATADAARAPAPAAAAASNAKRADVGTTSEAPASVPQSGAATQAKDETQSHPAPSLGGSEAHPASTAPALSASSPRAEPTHAPAAATAPAPATAPAAATASTPTRAVESPNSLDSGPRAADSPVDAALASKGKALFAQKACASCHKMDVRLVGPPLGPVPRQRSAAWIMAMIQRPVEMTRTDAIAKQLLQQYKVQMMPAGRVSPDEARALLEYIKSGGK